MHNTDNVVIVEEHVPNDLEIRTMQARHMGRMYAKMFLHVYPHNFNRMCEDCAMLIVCCQPPSLEEAHRMLEVCYGTALSSLPREEIRQHFNEVCQRIKEKLDPLIPDENGNVVYQAGSTSSERFNKEKVIFQMNTLIEHVQENTITTFTMACLFIYLSDFIRDMEAFLSNTFCGTYAINTVIKQEICNAFIERAIDDKEFVFNNGTVIDAIING